MPDLPDELVEEIFLRFPPDEPAALVRASLASKPWLAVLTGPAFRRRYREFHGDPPMLGFLCSLHDGSNYYKEDPPPRFNSTAEFGARVPDFLRRHGFNAWDCRHGRVLLVDEDYNLGDSELRVWDPMTGCTRMLEGYGSALTFGFAVLCAVSGCDHRACHTDPFKVICVGVEQFEEGDSVALAHACVSLPDTGHWSKPIPPHKNGWKEPCPRLDLAAADAFIREMPSVLVDDALYFLLGYEGDADRVGILKYSLSSESLSQIDPPHSVVARDPILMAMKDGSLGFAHVKRLTQLHLWSKKIGSDGVGASWTHDRVVDLKNLLPHVKDHPKKIHELIGSVEGHDIIFVKTHLGVYQIDLKTLQWIGLKCPNMDQTHALALIPYMSFYNRPAERAIPGDAEH